MGHGGYGRDWRGKDGKCLADEDGVGTGRHGLADPDRLGTARYGLADTGRTRSGRVGRADDHVGAEHRAQP